MFETTQSQVDETANQPEFSAAAEDGGIAETGPDSGSETPFITVRYNKEDMPLSKDAAVTYAQKGMNYDKVNERLKTATEKLSEYEGNDFFKLAQEYADKSGRPTEDMVASIRQYLNINTDDHAAKQTIVNQQMETFMRQNPGVDPRQLPETVLNLWKKGIPLSEAYFSYQAETYRQQAQMLEKQLEQTKTNQKNAQASMGRAESSGTTYGKPLSEEVIRNMTPQELEKNHKRIWAFLTNTK